MKTKEANDMTEPLVIYPEASRKNIRKIISIINADPETVYAMMLMTASLMDLNPWDEKVAEIIIDDCTSNPSCG